MGEPPVREVDRDRAEPTLRSRMPSPMGVLPAPPPPASPTQRPAAARPGRPRGPGGASARWPSPPAGPPIRQVTADALQLARCMWPAGACGPAHDRAPILVGDRYAERMPEELIVTADSAKPPSEPRWRCPLQGFTWRSWSSTQTSRIPIGRPGRLSSVASAARSCKWSFDRSGTQPMSWRRTTRSASSASAVPGLPSGRDALRSARGLELLPVAAARAAHCRPGRSRPARHGAVPSWLMARRQGLLGPCQRRSVRDRHRPSLGCGRIPRWTTT